MRKNTIIICTWHYFQNIGSQLQAVALFNFIKDLGFDVKILNYRNEKYCKSRFKEKIKTFYNLFSFLCFLFRNKRSGLFNKFCYKNFNLTSLFYGKESIYFDEQPCVIVFGSDQIWAPNAFDDVYFGNFSKLAHGVRKISYAPSIVTKQLFSKEQAHIIKECISSFSSVSFREPISSSVADCFGLTNYEIVCDPSLLMDKSFYEKLSNKKATKKIKNKKYILNYFLTQTNATSSVCASLKGKKGYSVINISKQSEDIADLNLFSKTGPEEFLALVKDSSFVLTDSFHGVCFSLIFRKEFLVVERFDSSDDLNQNKRITHLLDIFGLSDRIVPFGIDNVNDFKINKIDFENAWKKADKFINDSKAFLKNGVLYGE